MNALTVQIIRKAQLDGNRVFIADDGKGDYGIITNQPGTLVVSFWPAPFGGMNFATSHKSNTTLRDGQGFLIAEDRYAIDTINTTAYLERNICRDGIRPKTLAEHLKYYESSHYKEIK